MERERVAAQERQHEETSRQIGVRQIEQEEPQHDVRQMEDEEDQHDVRQTEDEEDQHDGSHGDYSQEADEFGMQADDDQNVREGAKIWRGIIF